MAMTINFQGLLDRMTDADNGSRLTATSDLLNELQKDGLKLDEEDEKKITGQIISLLQDQSGEVQNLAVKCLGNLVKRIRMEQKQYVVQSLCQMLRRESEQTRKIAAIALRTVVAEIPISRRTFEIIENDLNPNLLVAIHSVNDIKVQLESLDILVELIDKFGSQIDRNHEILMLLARIIKKNDLYYRYGHILMKKMPKELVDSLIKQPNLNPSKLIPVLIQDNPYFNKCSETIRYLEHCVKNLNCTSSVVYNYLFELYARHRDEQVLLEFLEQQLPADKVQQQCHLDLQLCLRLCTDLQLKKTCVAIYSAMGLYDEAVNLALTFDIELAKKMARKVDTDEYQKRLWLNIARYVLTRDLDLDVATGLLKECRLLKIEDILPFFPNHTTIDYKAFRGAIRQSLQEYKNQLTTLKDGTYDSIAEEIRTEIKSFKARYSVIKLNQKCEICFKGLLSRSFYVFPCGHLFHHDCIGFDATDECLYCGSTLVDLINKPPQVGVDYMVD